MPEPPKSYSVGLAGVSILVLLGWLTVLVAVFLILTLMSETSSGSPNRTVMWSRIGNYALVIVAGFLLIVLSQVIEAVVDTALNTREIVELLREVRLQNGTPTPPSQPDPPSGSPEVAPGTGKAENPSPS